MNSMEFNKIAGAAIGALLIFLLLNFFSGLIYGTEGGEHVAEGEVVLAYAVPAESGATEKKPEVIDLFALLSKADPAEGEKVSRACGACHSFKEDDVKIGPPLYDVVGRDIASVAGFSYSDAMTAQEGVWTPEHLFNFIHDPQKAVPGTLMTYAGMDDAADRANLIAYLNTIGGSPIELTEGLQPLAPAEGEKAEAGAETETASTGEAADDGAKAADKGATAAGKNTETAPATSEAPAEENATADGSAAAEGADKPAADAAATEGASAEGTSADETATQPAETEEAATPETEAAAPADKGATEVAALGGDAAAGEKIFRRCKICHSLEPGENKIGPSLHGVIGRDIGSEEGYQYSDAMLAEKGVWTVEKLNAYLKDPKGAIPGNKMPFPGLPSEEDRLNVLTYIQQASK